MTDIFRANALLKKNREKKIWVNEWRKEKQRESLRKRKRKLRKKESLARREDNFFVGSDFLSRPHTQTRCGSE